MSAQESASASAGAGTGPSGDSPLQRKMWSAWNSAGKPRPNRKELNESFQFFTKTSKVVDAYPARKQTLIDVCGGHGLISMVFLAYQKVTRAIVIDKEHRPSLDVMWAAWKEYLPPRESLEVRLGDFRGVLGPALAEAGAGAALVVACHACAHLTDEILEACSRGGADFAVMPCCHRDHHRDADKGQIKFASDQMGIPLGRAMELVRMGRMQALGYTVRFRTIDESVSPHNCILIGEAQSRRCGAFAGVTGRKDSGTSNRDRRNRGMEAVPLDNYHVNQARIEDVMCDECTLPTTAVALPRQPVPWGLG